MAATLLLFAGVAVELLACAGVLVMPTALDRLHYVSAGATATLLIAAAVVVREGATTLASRAVLIALLTLFTAPVLTHATARAIDARTEDR